MSVSPAYLAERGIKAANGPAAGKYLTDEGCVRRNLAWRDGDGRTLGFYDLEGGADGELIYVWTDMAAFKQRPS